MKALDRLRTGVAVAGSCQRHPKRNNEQILRDTVLAR